jgi:probable F420-dependent oxidoreductase
VDVFIHGGYSHPDHFLEIAKTAERLGIDGMLVPDHVFLPKELATPYPYTADGKLPMGLDTSWPDPWVLIAAIGGATSTLRFLTNVYILAMRNPLLVAKTAGTAAVTTGGRVLMGVGIGWMREEYDSLGARFTKRGKMTDRAIEILRRIWRDGELDAYHDEFYDFPALIMEPKPAAPVPILIGGESPAAFDRAARLGDGYVSTPHDVPSHLAMKADLHRRLAALGRDPGAFQYRAGMSGIGDIDECLRLAEAGLAGVSFRLWPSTEHELAAKLAAVEDFAQRIVEPLAARVG